MGRCLRNHSVVYKTPKVPFDRTRFDAELKLAGQFGLKCKREIQRVHFMLGHMRTIAKVMLMKSATDPKRILEGNALLRRLHNLGILPKDQTKLEFVLALKEENLLERRLQTIVFRKGFAKSIHHARVLIRSKLISVGKQIVDVPSFMVRVSSEPLVQLAPNTPLTNPEKLGRRKRKARKDAKGQ
ncbi:40S ribosomal protein S9, putative [Entamoeba invadens IP1]|uniref:Small ribosomal subunit protein uS4 n=2 Tax=Entamoeba invadens TaxID=33085 RepID=A0A0A1TXP2_ENTIV|nr:40S ribosomal protein S9, putative [Entamoeba invadens IP1]XP_004260244.1 40S ribosomal protein S9, putative [Entamoeba invadens IP1]XP_004261004.1 40S ribosomal protein S9, putative [Entamoeba invadens IP1]BAN40421.1 40S ribosomal protein S9, putative [Entamoeba invadens]ELP84310.1 40S ribosomal protein S9, putative [Entamoeba invadens IP1]ELP93473.1 40S ribosomal protein S9, putative [Entamoeba invadens IP1]ELP94233.1 40S ribosomal protein S9, putative [Entamoeba invadens IP1]|eukprot:XP_004183656.1 40S ribosomal protein S9, putative [Entamoeba invadens IP1]